MKPKRTNAKPGQVFWRVDRSGLDPGTFHVSVSINGAVDFWPLDGSTCRTIKDAFTEMAEASAKLAKGYQIGLSDSPFGRVVAIYRG